MSEITIIWVVSIVQIAIALGLVNVWLVRFGSATKYRGAGAKNMKEEFAVYGLPTWFMYMVGAAKILIAVCMIVGFWIPVLIYPASALLAVLMIGAIAMHIKVKDPFIKFVPAILMLVMALLAVYLVVYVN